MYSYYHTDSLKKKVSFLSKRKESVVVGSQTIVETHMSV